MNLSSANVEYPKKRRLFEELLKIKDLYKKKIEFHLCYSCQCFDIYLELI